MIIQKGLLTVTPEYRPIVQMYDSFATKPADEFDDPIMSLQGLVKSHQVQYGIKDHESPYPAGNIDAQRIGTPKVGHGGQVTLQRVTWGKIQVTWNEFAMMHAWGLEEMAGWIAADPLGNLRQTPQLYGRMTTMAFERAKLQDFYEVWDNNPRNLYIPGKRFFDTSLPVSMKTGVGNGVVDSIVPNKPFTPTDARLEYEAFMATPGATGVRGRRPNTFFYGRDIADQVHTVFGPPTETDTPEERRLRLIAQQTPGFALAYMVNSSFTEDWGWGYRELSANPLDSMFLMVEGNNGQMMTATGETDARDPEMPEHLWVLSRKRFKTYGYNYTRIRRYCPGAIPTWPSLSDI